MDSAVVLAAGRGSRMRRPDDAATLTARQAEVAYTGFKAMIPVGRPFIDYVLSGLADAGYHRICIVIGPDGVALRNHVLKYKGGRFEMRFAVQQEALGTADAVLAAADFAADEPFLLVNSDNYYPKTALEGLRLSAGPTVAAFRPEGLRRGNISEERVRNFALLAQNSNGILECVLEKPSDEIVSRAKDDLLVSMNCWRFNPLIFDACRAIPRSVRGEFELTDAVAYAIDHLAEHFQVLEVNEPVLDLSTQADIAEVTRRLASIEVRL